MILTFEQFMEYVPSKPAYALFGHPAAHSLSPEIHSFIFSKRALECEYFVVDVAPENLSDAVVRAKKILMGFNCTIPHKKAIIPFLDKYDYLTAKSCAANTVHISDGRLLGYNTDGEGFCQSISRCFGDIKGKNAVLLGSGGAASIIAIECLRMGANLTIAARNMDKAAALVSLCKDTFTNAAVCACPFDLLPCDTQILINATPIGMAPNDGQSPVDLSTLLNLEFVFDTIYNPPMTKMLKQAKELSIAFENGLSMLFIQALRAQDIWFSKSLPLDIINEGYANILACLARRRLSQYIKKPNILLSGFMGSGKTTVGKLLAAKLGFTFIDSDDVIEKLEEMTINDIFSEKGEEYFRLAETKALSNLALQSGLVIAAGGGAMVNRDNFMQIEDRCLVVYLYAPIENIFENLKGDKSRPLLNDPDRKRRTELLYNSRLKSYASNCHITADYFKNADDTAVSILSLI